jgi:hypothetical protein
LVEDVDYASVNFAKEKKKDVSRSSSFHTASSPQTTWKRPLGVSLVRELADPRTPVVSENATSCSAEAYK